MFEELKQPNFSPLALEILHDRYLHRDSDDNVTETPKEMLIRVAKHVASAEKSTDRVYWTSKFYAMMADLDFLPNSPTLMNAGRPAPHGQLAACFVVGIEDSMESICGALRKQMLIHKTGGGTGFNFSKLRPKNSTVNSTNGKASGPVSFMRLFDLSTEVIQQGGMRRGANMAILNCDHPDIEEFISCKDNEGKITNFNLSVGITDEFMKRACDDLTSSAAALLHKIAEHAWKTGDPGVVFLDTMNRDNPCPELGRIESTNPCVTGETCILTDKGYRPIADCVGEKIKVWNGHEWSEVEPRVTGENQPILLVKFSNGTEIQCTPYHRFKLNDDTIIEAQSLKEGDQLCQYELPTVESDAKDAPENEMWCRGFYVGDGTRRRGAATKTQVVLYGEKKHLIGQFADVLRCARKNVKDCFVVTLKNELNFDKAFVPNASFSVRDRVEYLAGLIDADGTRNSKEGSIAIAASDKHLLDEVKAMLNTLGCKATVSLVREAGKRYAPDGKGGKKLYNKRAEYRLLISSWYVQKLVNIGLKTYRVNLSGNPDRNAARKISVVTVKKAGTAQTVYCLTEPRYHMFIANGIPVMNCGESPLLPSESCNLGSINLAHMVTSQGEIDWIRLRDTVITAVRFLDNVIDVNQYPLPETAEAVKRTRKIGLGVMGWADMLFKLHIPYDSAEAVQLAEELMTYINTLGHVQSLELGHSKGAYIHSDSMRRNATVTCIAPTGTLALLADCSSGIEPVFSLHHTRKITLGDGTIKEVEIVNPHYADLCADTSLSDEAVAEIAKTAYQIPWKWHIDHQAAFQRGTDLAVSKTVNLPKSATVDDVIAAYVYAWEMGCKGTTIYRDGSRNSQVLTEAPVRCKECDV